MANVLVWAVWGGAAFACIASALAVVSFTNPFFSALALIGNLSSLAVLYLLLYNLIFILPLLVVLLLAVYGISQSRLQQFLQQRFWIFACNARIQRFQRSLENLQNKFLCGRKAAVKKNRPDERFDCISKYGRALRTTTAQFALAQRQLRTDRQFARQCAKRLAVDEAGAHARQITLGHCRINPEQLGRNHAVQHRVAEKLQPLVMR